MFFGWKISFAGHSASVLSSKTSDWKCSSMEQGGKISRMTSYKSWIITVIHGNTVSSLAHGKTPFRPWHWLFDTFCSKSFRGEAALWVWYKWSHHAEQNSYRCKKMQKKLGTETDGKEQYLNRWGMVISSLFMEISDLMGLNRIMIVPGSSDLQGMAPIASKWVWTCKHSQWEQIIRFRYGTMRLWPTS